MDGAPDSLAAATTDAPVTLGYANDERRHRRRIRRVLRWILLVALLAAVWKWGIPFASSVWDQSKYLAMQRRWMRYAAPAGKVVFDVGPDDVARPRAAGTGYAPVSISFRADGASSLPSAGFRGQALDEIDRTWRPGGIFGAEAFLGRRDASGMGGERLVFVDAVLRESPAGRNVEFLAFAMTPATLRPGTRLGRNGGGGFTKIFPYLGSAERLQLFAGQPDPADPARFTIPYDLDGQRGTISGRLLGSGGVELKIADGPLQGR
jgi:hypothetical protein